LNLDNKNKLGCVIRETRESLLGFRISEKKEKEINLKLKRLISIAQAKLH